MEDGQNAEELVIRINSEFTNAVLPVTIFVGIEAFMAFFGNLIIIYVFVSRYHDCSFRYFVLCLAFVDFISSLTTMPGEMVTQLNWYNYRFPEVCKGKSFFNVFTVSAEALCLMIIAVDRYLKVCRPLGKQITSVIAKYVCVVIYICAIIIAIPVAIYWGVHSHEQNYNGTRINVTVCEKDAKYEKTEHPLQYSLSIEIILSISLIFMFILYVFIAKTFVHHRRRRRDPGEEPFGIDAKVVRKTWIMFILTVAFIITTILYLTLLSFIARSDDILQKLSDGEKTVYFLFFRLYFINHVINPIVYGILDSEFRKHVKDIKDSIISRLKC